MAHQPRLKSLHPLNHFAMKMKITPCIPIRSTHLKMKALLQYAYVVLRHVRRIAEAVVKMKPAVLDFHACIFRKKAGKKKKKLLSAGFNIEKQFNRASSHVTPMCENTFAEEFDASGSYCDSTWTSIASTDQLEYCGDEPISGYLRWLEEKNSGDSGTADVEDQLNEIDRLAEKFIEMCHEKFRLEKQESYRRYLQEMMAS